MISKKNRFHGHHALDYTYKQGKTARGELMSLKFASSKGESYRLSVVVSKKVHKSAVVRNRIRRRLYESMRRLDQNNPLPKRDMILTVFDQRLETISSDEVDRITTKLVDKAR